MKKTLMLALLAVLFACKSKVFDEKPEIKNDQDFVDWLSGKEFSTVEEIHVFKEDGSKAREHDPIVIKFDGGLCQVNDCKVAGYSLDKNESEYIVKISYGEEIFELRFDFKKGRKLLASTLFNWEREKLPKSNSYDRLRILVSNEVRNGSAIRITDDDIKLPGAKPMFMDGFAEIGDITVMDTITTKRKKIFESIKFDLDTTDRMASAILQPTMDEPSEIIYFESKKREVTAIKTRFMGASVIYSTIYFFDQYGKVIAKKYQSEGLKDDCENLIQYYDENGYAFASFCNGKFDSNLKGSDLDKSYVDNLIAKYSTVGGD